MNKRFVILIIIVLIISGGVGYFLYSKYFKIKSHKIDDGGLTFQWQEKGLAIAGKFADAELVDLGGGKWRMYYSVEPEVPGNKLELYSATSADGKTWTQEPSVRKEFAVFPDVIKLSDNQYRLYYQNAGVIKSALSNDGLIWTDEPGVRIDAKEEGFALENVGAQSTIMLENGAYVMAYRGTINQPYKTTEKLPNNTTGIYFWATSKDGLNFEKQGIAIDTRNETLFGAADGGEWVNWDDGNLRLYFWSYGGVYHSVFENASTDNLGKFSAPTFDFTNKTDTSVKFSPNPPADPTFGNIGGKWFMFYGQHDKGIYYATLEFGVK